MTRSRRPHRPPQRAATRGRVRSSAPSRALAEHPTNHPLVVALREAMRAAPLHFAAVVCQFVDLLSPDTADDPDSLTLPAFVDTLLGVDIAETTHALHVIAGFSSDELLRARIRGELARRRQPVPTPLADIADFEVVQTLQMTALDASDEDIILGVRWCDGSELVAIILINHMLGSVVKDLIVAYDRIEPLLAKITMTATEDGLSVRPISPADARARVKEASRRWATRTPDLQSEGWPGGRAFLHRILERMPPGGQGLRAREGVAASLEGVVPDSLPPPLDTVVRDLPAPIGRQVSSLYAAALHETGRCAAPSPSGRTGLLRPVLAMLDEAAAGGIPLTAAGWMKPTVVQRVWAAMEIDAPWMGRGTRENVMLPVAHLRTALANLGLLRKHQGRLLLTRAGAACRRDEAKLWDHLANRLCRSGSAFEQQVKVLWVLLFLTTGGIDDYRLDLHVQVAGCLQGAGGQVPIHGPGLTYPYHRATDDVRAVLGLFGVVQQPWHDERLALCRAVLASLGSLDYLGT